METLKRARVHALASPCPKDRISAQPLQGIQGQFVQALSQELVRDAGVMVVAHQRWQQGANVLSLLPAAFGFFPDQVEA
jgi:hypothetical protein